MILNHHYDWSWCIMAHRCIRLIMNVNDSAWITYSLFWQLNVNAWDLALHCHVELDQLQMVMCQAGVNAAVVMFDLEAMGRSCRVMIRWLCWFPTVCQSVRVMSKLFMMQVTWPPPQTNERVGGYEFLGGEAEAKQIDEINDFWYLLLIQVFSIYCLQDFGSIFVINILNNMLFWFILFIVFSFFLYFVTLSVFGFSRCFHDSARYSYSIPNAIQYNQVKFSHIQGDFQSTLT